jgi:hypothetical protein
VTGERRPTLLLRHISRLRFVSAAAGQFERLATYRRTFSLSERPPSSENASRLRDARFRSTLSYGPIFVIPVGLQYCVKCKRIAHDSIPQHLAPTGAPLAPIPVSPSEHPTTAALVPPAQVGRALHQRRIRHGCCRGRFGARERQCTGLGARG